MSTVVNKKYKNRENTDIIQAILDSNKLNVVAALENDSNCINSIHEDSGMNAAMLCVLGRVPDVLAVILARAGSCLVFSHTSANGDDLQEVAFATLDKNLIDAVEKAYKKYAPHIINNWPEP